jgi:hypothetical protein
LFTGRYRVYFKNLLIRTRIELYTFPLAFLDSKRLVIKSSE